MHLPPLAVGLYAVISKVAEWLGRTQLLGSLASIQGALGFIPNIAEAKYIDFSCKLSTRKVEAGGSGVQGHPELHSESEASLDLKTKTKPKK